MKTNLYQVTTKDGILYLNGRILAAGRSCHQHRSPGWDSCSGCRAVREWKAVAQ